MNKFNNKILIGLCLATLGFAGCSDFEDVNISPSQVGEEYVLPDYFLSQSIYLAQQDPDVAERVVVYNWASAARVCGEMSFLNIGRYNDGYNAAYFNQVTNWLKYATFAIQWVDKRTDVTGHDAEFYPNIKAFARIWRALLIAEYTDTFGPYTLDAFTVESPTFNSVEETYDFILTELKEATADINTSVEPTEMEAKGDPGFAYNAAKWQKLGNSLRLRYAMRLSEVNPSKAKAEFEDAAKGNLLTDLSDMYAVQEYDQWNAWAGVFTRSWDDQALSSTMSNILVGLGGIAISEQRPDLASYTKPMNYLGMKFDQHYAENTDNPTKQFWMDGIPENIDPRGLKIFCLPNDQTAENFVDKGSSSNHGKHFFADDAGNALVKLDAQFTWNYYPVGQSSSFSSKFAKNNMMNNIRNTGVLLGKNYCNSSNKRVWFGPWETYFLLAEASLYGWTTGTSAQVAYENGVRSSFEYFGVSQYVDSYLASEDYNRVGTSVKFTHTVEPSNMTVNYKDGYTNASKTMTYQYPDATKILYKGKKLNDQLTKIITQKYIAQTPYLALEMWNDYRRLGLPFFDMPANESILTGSDMEAWKPSSYLDGQKWQYYPQRMRFPSSLNNADPEGYAYALQLLGGANNVMTPLWWSIGARN